MLIAENVVAICKKLFVSWSGLKTAIGAAIRRQLLTEVPAILKMHAHTGAQARSDAELNTAIEEPGQGGQSIANHGGKLFIVEARQRKLFIAMSGDRQECASAQVTLRQEFVVMIKRVAP